MPILRIFSSTLMVLLGIVISLLVPAMSSSDAAVDCKSAVEAATKNPLAPMTMQMRRATGMKLPFDSGDYNMCRNIEVGLGFRTKFFIVQFNVGEIGVCLPDVCSDKDITTSLIAMVSPSLAPMLPLLHLADKAGAAKNPFNVKDDRLPWGAGSSAAGGVVAALVIVVIASTALVSNALHKARAAFALQGGLLHDDIPPPEESPLKLPSKLAWCEAFSLVGPSGTWTSLWQVEKVRPTDCLNGMKVLSMLFIIMGHGLHEPLTLLGYSNAECIKKSSACLDAAFTQPGQYLMYAGRQGVDTFFFIGGFLLSFIGKSRAVPVLLGTVMRLARLLPLFGFAMMMYILIAPYIASGPFSPRFQAEVSSACGDGSWWSELLFINSVYPWIPNQGGCMGWSWYLSNDMIFAVIGMMLVGVWKRSARVAWIIATILFVSCGVVSMQQALHYKMQYNIADASYIDYTQQLYFRPWHRLPSFLVGLMAPWGLHLLEQIGIDRGSQPTSLRAKLIVHISCLLALAVLAVCIFLPWTNAASSGPEATARKPDQWSLWSNAFWIGWSRPVWCVALLVLALACYFDYLPLVNAVFAARIFGPLSNLTFGAYLFHPIIIKIIAASQDGYFTYSALDGIERAMLYSVLAYSVAIVSWCLVEKPFATLTMWLVPKKVSNKPAKKVAQAPGQKSCTRTKGDSDSKSSTPFNEKATEQP